MALPLAACKGTHRANRVQVLEDFCLACYSTAFLIEHAELGRI